MKLGGTKYAQLVLIKHFAVGCRLCPFNSIVQSGGVSLHESMKRPERCENQCEQEAVDRGMPDTDERSERRSYFLAHPTAYAMHRLNGEPRGS